MLSIEIGVRAGENSEENKRPARGPTPDQPARPAGGGMIARHYYDTSMLGAPPGARFAVPHTELHNHRTMQQTAPVAPARRARVTWSVRVASALRMAKDDEGEDLQKGMVQSSGEWGGGAGATGTPSAVEDLPGEVLDRILAQLEPQHLSNAARTCRRWADASASERIWCSLYLRHPRMAAGALGSHALDDLDPDDPHLRASAAQHAQCAYEAPSSVGWREICRAELLRPRFEEPACGAVHDLVRLLQERGETVAQEDLGPLRRAAKRYPHLACAVRDGRFHRGTLLNDDRARLLERDFDYHMHVLKLAVLGDEAVGKSLFLRRFLDDALSGQGVYDALRYRMVLALPGSYIPTIGFDFAAKTVRSRSLSLSLYLSLSLSHAVRDSMEGAAGGRSHQAAAVGRVRAGEVQPDRAQLLPCLHGIPDGVPALCNIIPCNDGNNDVCGLIMSRTIHVQHLHVDFVCTCTHVTLRLKITNPNVLKAGAIMTKASPNAYYMEQVRCHEALQFREGPVAVRRARRARGQAHSHCRHQARA